MRRLARTLLALLACAVLGGALTLLSWPLWSWIEAFTGVESLGHSGPAAWCFAATSAALFVAWVGWSRRPRR